MTRRTLEETVSLIDDNDTAYIGEIYLLYCERNALKDIVLGARQRIEYMREQLGDSTHPHTQGALYQAEHDLEVIENAVSGYELEIEEETE